MVTKGWLSTTSALDRGPVYTRTLPPSVVAGMVLSLYCGILHSA